MAGRRPTPRQGARRETPRAARGHERLVCWYRVVPVALLALTLLLVGVVAANPTGLGRALHPVRHAEAIEASCERHGVDPLLACAVIKCESDWDEDAHSAAGAVGLMQLMPQTSESLSALGVVDAGRWDPEDLTDPEVNIEYGVACLGYLQGQLSSADEVVAAYNAGIGTVQGWLAEGGSIPEDVEYAETRAYLENVRRAYEGYRQSYPNGITGD